MSLLLTFLCLYVLPLNYFLFCLFAFNWHCLFFWFLFFCFCFYWGAFSWIFRFPCCLCRSQSRYVDLEKPKKKKAASTTSLVSIPNSIKLSMLNSGLLSFGKDLIVINFTISCHNKLSIVSISDKVKLSARGKVLINLLKPIKQFQLINLWISDENNPLSQTIPDTPTELKFFVKLCEQRRKFPVLYKIEFTVSASVCKQLKRNLYLLIWFCDVFFYDF